MTSRMESKRGLVLWVAVEVAVVTTNQLTENNLPRSRYLVRLVRAHDSSSSSATHHAFML